MRPRAGCWVLRAECREEGVSWRGNRAKAVGEECLLEDAGGGDRVQTVAERQQKRVETSRDES